MRGGGSPHSPPPPPPAHHPVRLRPQELGPVLRPTAWRPNSGSGPGTGRRTGERAKSGGASPHPHHRLDFPTSASRRRSAGSERHLWVTKERCARLRESGSPLGFSPPREPGPRPSRSNIGNSPRPWNSPLRTVYPGAVPTLQPHHHQ